MLKDGDSWIKTLWNGRYRKGVDIDPVNVFQRVHLPGDVVSELVYMTSSNTYALCLYYENKVCLKPLHASYDASLFDAGVFIDMLLKAYKLGLKTLLIETIEANISACLLPTLRTNHA